jgi:hypothetical protein
LSVEALCASADDVNQALFKVYDAPDNFARRASAILNFLDA